MGIYLNCASLSATFHRADAPYKPAKPASPAFRLPLCKPQASKSPPAPAEERSSTRLSSTGDQADSPSKPSSPKEQPQEFILPSPIADLPENPTVPQSTKKRAEPATLSPSPANQPETSMFSPAKYEVFISHASEDKAMIAIPLRDMLMKHSIAAFVDEADIEAGTQGLEDASSAMETARIAVIVLSPEFVAQKSPVKELMFFLRRQEERKEDSERIPVIIPFFYRLAVPEVYAEPRLERIDSHGNSLYLKTLFLERMSAGEPEANIENIRAGLRKLLGMKGVENVVGASNDGVHAMYRRREILLRYLCDKIRQLVRTETMTMATNMISPDTGDMFHAYFTPMLDTPRLALGVESRDEYWDVRTQEHGLLEKVLDESQDLNRDFAILGNDGVGKTSLLRAISSLVRVKERFRDGVHYLSLGLDATRHDLIRELSYAVQFSGGPARAKNMRRELEMEIVIESFRSWFSKKNCLFVIDDVFQSKEITSSVIYELLRLHVGGDESNVILATRSSDIASRTSACFTLKPRSTLGEESRRILMHYAGLQPEDDKDEEAVKDILERCSGLPLLLVFAGKAVKLLKLRRENDSLSAFHVYSQYLKRNVRSKSSVVEDSYPRLDASLITATDLLEKRKESIGFQVNGNMADIYRRLSVLKRQAKVPLTMLKHLWGLENERQAAIVAGEFEKVGMAEVLFERQGSDRVEKLRLHDSVREFAISETRRYKKELEAHEALLKGYGRALAMKEECLEWWHTSLKDDGYIHGNLCRHLLGAGRISELVQLLLLPQWTERQLQVNGVLTLEVCCRHQISAELQGKWN